MYDQQGILLASLIDTKAKMMLVANVLILLHLNGNLVRATRQVNFHIVFYRYFIDVLSLHKFRLALHAYIF